MNLLGELKVKTKSGSKTFKVTNRSLYKTQIALNSDGIVDLVTRLAQGDVLVIVELARNSIIGEITEEQLLDEDLNLMELGVFFAEQIALLIEGKKKKPTLQKKKA